MMQSQKELKGHHQEIQKRVRRIRCESNNNRIAIALLRVTTRRKRFAIVEELLYNRLKSFRITFAIALQLIFNRFRISLRSLCYRRAITLLSLRKYFTIAFNGFATALQAIRVALDRFASVLRLLSDP
jgi:hypothetical protein